MTRQLRARELTLSAILWGDIKHSPSPTGPRGFHFYTLNLEKAVAFILERCNLIPPSTPGEEEDEIIGGETAGGFLVVNGPGSGNVSALARRRLSSVVSDPHNRVIVEDASSSGGNTGYLASAEEAGIPKESLNTRATTLAISEGEGSLGREATWDDYPNGRWGDARSPGVLSCRRFQLCSTRPL